jgi:hypothetical protein
MKLSRSIFGEYIDVGDNEGQPAMLVAVRRPGESLHLVGLYLPHQLYVETARRIAPESHDAIDVVPITGHWQTVPRELYARPVEPAEPVGFPEVVCLCGSTRFYDAFQQANYDLTMQGKIVLSVGFYPHATAEAGHGEGVGHDSDQKIALDELHKRKIDLADRVFVLNVGGYIGKSTQTEIEYAQDHGKVIEYLAPFIPTCPNCGMFCRAGHERDHWTLSCDDPQCGDSTWDHVCNAGGRWTCRIPDPTDDFGPNGFDH